MKKILYIGNKLSKKGATVTSIETLGLFLQQEGYEVVTVSSKKNKILRMLDMMWNTIYHSKNTSFVLIDTYSTINFQYAVIIGVMCRTFGLPYIPILRGGNLPSRLKKNKKQSRKLFGNAITNVAPSRYLLEAFKKGGYTKLTYIPNTIQIDNYPFLLRKDIQPKLLWVRSFSKIYNPMLALHILEALLKAGYKNSELCMIGPEKDDTYRACKAYSDKKKLPVTFTGGLPKAEWIRRSEDYDIFINTTNVDNTPVSVIEAMALGLPVVSTNAGGVPFLIEDDVDGLLVVPDNAEIFSDKIQKILNKDLDYRTISLNARKKAERFDWNVVKEKWKTLLNS
ncbi:glycosyltransferase family 4 protein [Marixanthomonas ophiurae]|uniref:glycosyltransferase family 4 protein n=1 Tax=Marixanthomonas ophiurae TaxID=387659 RepID=UPI001EFE7F62|nr:glycosyltransferase family 4 protein [Marixanthomonas ophiurae]